MAGQTVLIPTSAPLFIVDRSWLKPPKVVNPGQNKFQARAGDSSSNIKYTVLSDNAPSSSQDHQESMNRDVQFVNYTYPNLGKKEDEALRRQVRSHVMTGTKRRTSRLKLCKKIKSPKNEISGTTNEEDTEEERLRQNINFSSSDLTLACSGSSTPLYGVSNFEIKPYFYKFINYYLYQISHLLYPLDTYFSYNPVKANWFPLAMTDEALLHTIMFSAAIQLSIVDANKVFDAREQLVGTIFRLLSSRIKGSQEISDATAGAVSCLVLCENLMGNRKSWQLHRNGLRDIVRSRGGLLFIDPSLQMKIIRADIEGAVDHLSIPCLSSLERLTQSLYDASSQHLRLTPSEAIAEVLKSAALTPELKASFVDLSKFAIAVQYFTSQDDLFIDPRAFDEDIVSIQRDLLTILACDGTDLEQAICLGSLIFVKSIARALHPKAGSKILIRRLKCSLSEVDENLPPSLLLWLLFMGGIASCSGSKDQKWFLESLLTLSFWTDEMQTWEHAKDMLKKVLWVDTVHEKPCKWLWEEFKKDLGKMPMHD